MGFIEEFSILNISQYGFRQNKSTIDVVMHLIDSVMQGLERRDNALGVLDLFRAFDCINNQLLLQNLMKCGIRDLPYEWLPSYVSNSSVKINNTQLQKVAVHQGVAQGFILRPIIF